LQGRLRLEQQGHALDRLELVPVRGHQRLSVKLAPHRHAPPTGLLRLAIHSPQYGMIRPLRQLSPKSWIGWPTRTTFWFRPRGFGDPSESALPSTTSGQLLPRPRPSHYRCPSAHPKCGSQPSEASPPSKASRHLISPAQPLPTVDRRVAPWPPTDIPDP